nr:MAG: hypothetical protein 1 [Marnaviridae sp.]
MNFLNKIIRKTSNQIYSDATIVTSAVGICYDELKVCAKRVHITYGRVTISVDATYTTCIYDVVKYLIYQNYPGISLREANALHKTIHAFIGIKLLKREQLPLCLYGVSDNTVVTLKCYHLLGGSNLNILLPTYSHVSECEHQILDVVSKFTQQSIESGSAEDRQFRAESTMYGMIGSWLSNKGIDGEFVEKLIEDLHIFMKIIVGSKDATGYTIGLVSFIKFRTGKTLFSQANLDALLNYFQTLFADDFETQSVEDVFSTARTYLDKYDELKNAPIFKKLYRLAMYALSFSVFDAIGIHFDFLKYSTLEAEAIRRKYHMGADFVQTLLTTLLFVCERGYQCWKTGSLDPIYHSGSSYEKWFDMAQSLKVKAQFLAFPEAQGFTLFEYLADLRECIDQGESIARHAVRVGDYEKKLVRCLVSDLNLILATQTTKREAQKERTAPFCVCLYGGSSIGKTTLTDMLFLQYGKTFDLPLGSEFKYTHNPTAKYWDGFNSSQWFVIMDDIAFMHPNKASEGDPSVMETLQTNNRVAFVPDQADLADKGRTPFRARCVVSTTNCEDLNAVHYFQTPLAMQRRFPYIIDAQVKPEFSKYECMLDSSLTRVEQGEWPNYWNFVIKRPIPDGTNRCGQRAKLEVVEKFDNSDDFLAWFSKCAIEHERVQTLVSDSSKNMSTIPLCKKCYRNQNKCTCFETQAGWTFYERTKKAALDIVLNTMQTRYFHDALSYTLRQPHVYARLEEAFVAPSERLAELRAESNLDVVLGSDEFHDASDGGHKADATFYEATRTTFRNLGQKVQSNIGNPMLLGTIVAACGVLMGAYKFYKVMNPKHDLQTSISSNIGTKPKGEEVATQNVWFRDDYELSAFDISSLSTSWKTLDDESIVKKLSNNLIHISAHRNVDGVDMVLNGRALCLGGHIYVTNNHNLKDCGDLQLSVVHGKTTNGISQNITVLLTQGEINRFPAKDLCVFRMRSLPPKKDITSLFAKEATSFKGCGILLARNQDGSILANPVAALHRTSYADGPTFRLVNPWMCKPQSITQVGDCGALLLGKSNMGPVLLGCHSLGNALTAVSTTISKEFVDEALALFREPVVQCSTPLLNSESTAREIGPLHQKSVFRYLENGTANVYGSFSGFKQTPKSRVVPTLIQQSVIAEGYEVKHDKPVMAGWEPWRIAATDMVAPITQLDNTVVEECKEAFLNDILSSIDMDQLSQVSVYDDVTAMNGAAGVKFVDKMNRNTSMGNPWQRGKKFYIQPIPEQDGLTEPVEFVPEIQARIDSIIECYQRGERFMPNFCGHLKDEAVTFKKAALKKTRVFLGGPGDWSFVVRKYLLSVIRLIQNNRFVFETGVGTNACSTEWQDIRKYLTQNGESRMIAGDYGSFDKTMPPTIILAAYDIIREICVRAGYTNSELRVVQGIAEDTAFPLVDFNGDLVEFYGSNPSGHPLTVIINSLANSIYMRYCYAKLNPKKTASTFKQDVALMTYGDDNVMGVSKFAPYFNHTTIQAVLAEAGIKYTMADKEADSIPYINIDNVSFLKRRWVWCDDTNAYLAPLEEDSISKSLTVCVRSKTLSAEYHAIAVMESAYAEYFFYGKKKFLEKQAMFLRIVDKNDLSDYLTPNSFPSWDELRDRFWRCSGVRCD